MLMKKYKIGFTTGAYDIFHIGHLNAFKNAKSICEYLIVGVLGDELVLDYKLDLLPKNWSIQIVGNYYRKQKCPMN